MNIKEKKMVAQVTISPRTSMNGGTGVAASVLEKKKAKRWWWRLVDVEEAKGQLSFSFPMILTNASLYMIPLVSMMFVGHLGEIQLVGPALATSWTAVTGLSFMIGLSGTLETLCGQAYGAQLHTMLGIYLQSSCIISVLFSILIAIMWWYTQPIMLLLHQTPTISKEASIYMKYSILIIFAYAFLQNIQRFLQTQSVVFPLMVYSLLSLAFQIVVAYVFIHLTGLGFKGAPLAVSVSLWILVLLLAIHVKIAQGIRDTWIGFSLESFKYFYTTLKHSIPSAATVCLEYWAFEIKVILAGLMPNSETTAPLIAICVHTQAITFMITIGLSAAASTRVSNELGAGNLEKARNAMWVTLKLSFFMALMVVLALALGHKIWVGFFTNNSNIVNEFAFMMPFLAITIVLDSIKGILSGVSRGCGWQRLAMYTSLAAYYLIGMPISVLLAFKFKLYTKGLWIGLICALICQNFTLFLIATLRKWKGVEFSMNELGKDTDISL